MKPRGVPAPSPKRPSPSPSIALRGSATRDSDYRRKGWGRGNGGWRGTVDGQSKDTAHTPLPWMDSHTRLQELATTLPQGDSAVVKGADKQLFFFF